MASSLVRQVQELCEDIAMAEGEEEKVSRGVVDG
jgi:hypothetical protein